MIVGYCLHWRKRQGSPCYHLVSAVALGGKGGVDMEITISDELWARIKQKVDSGAYPSVEIVLLNAMIHLEESDKFADEVLASPEVQAKIEEGLDDLRNGRYTTYTSETLWELFEDIKQRGRERWEARHKWLVG